MPKRSKLEPANPRGRRQASAPRETTLNKKAVCVHIKQSSLDWIEAHLPRGISRSAFVDEAVEEKIGKERRR